jgi:hypothetical protein
VKKATKNPKPANPTTPLKNKGKGKAIEVNLVRVLNINFTSKLTFFQDDAGEGPSSAPPAVRQPIKSAFNLLQQYFDNDELENPLKRVRVGTWRVSEAFSKHFREPTLEAKQALHDIYSAKKNT